MLSVALLTDRVADVGVSGQPSAGILALLKELTGKLWFTNTQCSKQVECFAGCLEDQALSSKRLQTG